MSNTVVLITTAGLRGSRTAKLIERIPERGFVPRRAGPLPLCWHRKARLFWIILLLISRPPDHIE
jgi:hypothetical protein